jgi:hypothetical protein
MKTLFRIVSTIFVISSSLWAQGSTSQITGTIRDSSGSAVPGAQVRATQTATGLDRTVVAGSDGTYSIPNLPVGPYRLEITKEGFNVYVQSGIVLQVDSNPEVNPVLQVGTVNQQIIVEAAAAMVETRDTGVSQVIDNKRVVELPLNGRQATQLVLLSGAAVQMPPTNINSLRNFPTISIQIAGGLTGGTTYTLDGGSYNDPINSLNLPLPFPDALQEFKVETSALLARNGQHAGGAVNAVTKSGTNQFHGNAFEFLRNGVFDARNFFAPARDTLKRNQFGGTIGGPILKNKLFFFTGYQGTENRTAPATNTAFVLTPAALAGNFSILTSPACNSGKQVTLHGPFVNNQVSPSLFNSASVKYARYVPISSDPCGKVLYGVPANSSEREVPARVDYLLNDKNTLWARYYFANNSQPSFYDGKNGLLTTQPALLERSQSIVLGYSYVISPTTVNSFRGTLNRTHAQRTPPPFINPTDAGINVTNLAPDHTDLGVSGYFNFGGAWLGHWNSTGFQFADDMDFTRGAHEIVFGGNWIHEILNVSNAYYANGTFQFDGTATGNALADFMLGDLDSFTQQQGQQLAARHNYIGLYVQDTWKINPKLTLNAGLRWEPYLPPRNAHDWVETFDMNRFLQNQHSQVYVNAPAGLTFPGDAGYPGHSMTDQMLGLFAPRAGLSWDPRGDGRTTLRASYGIFNDQAHLLYNIGTSNNPPWGNAVTLPSPAGGFQNPWLGYPGGNPFPLQLDKNFQFTDYAAYNIVYPRYAHPPYMQQWNVTFQKQIGAEWLLSASYLGNSLTHLWLAGNINPTLYVPGTCGSGPCSSSGNANQRRFFSTLNPAQAVYYGALPLLDDGGTGTYNGLLLSLQRRLSKNVSALVNYTWSHCIDEGEINSDQPNSYRVSFNRNLDRANCDSDRRQIFNLSMVAYSPNSLPGFFGKLAEAWQLSPIIQAQSGGYFSITSSRNSALFDGALPVQIGDSKVSDSNIQQWFNPSTFVLNAPGQQGNAGRNNIVGPGIITVNVALVRSFPVTERQRVEFRAEAFNLLNHANFNNPNASIGSTTFSKVSTAADPRILQFALKFVF